MPTASILGGPDLHVDKGSMINLTCIIRYSPEPPSYIFWYHYEEVSISKQNDESRSLIKCHIGSWLVGYCLIFCGSDLV